MYVNVYSSAILSNELFHAVAKMYFTVQFEKLCQNPFPANRSILSPTRTEMQTETHITLSKQKVSIVPHSVSPPQPKQS